MPRTYTVAEIDRMREIVTELFYAKVPAGLLVNVSNPEAQIEGRLHTYIMAELSVQDLENELLSHPKPK